MEIELGAGEQNSKTNCVDCERYSKLGEVCVLEHGKRFLWEFCKDFQSKVDLPEYDELMKTVKHDLAQERKKVREKKKKEIAQRRKEREKIKQERLKERRSRIAKKVWEKRRKEQARKQERQTKKSLTKEGQDTKEEEEETKDEKGRKNRGTDALSTQRHARKGEGRQSLTR